MFGQKDIQQKGIITAPVFDKGYFQEGDVVCIRPSVYPGITQYWRGCPSNVFYAIVVNVLKDKLIVSYYNKGSKNNTSTFAIPIGIVVDGSIYVEVILRV